MKAALFEVCLFESAHAGNLRDGIGRATAAVFSAVGGGRSIDEVAEHLRASLAVIEQIVQSLREVGAVV